MGSVLRSSDSLFTEVSRIMNPNFGVLQRSSDRRQAERIIRSKRVVGSELKGDTCIFTRLSGLGPDSRIDTSKVKDALGREIVP